MCEAISKIKLIRKTKNKEYDKIYQINTNGKKA